MNTNYNGRSVGALWYQNSKDEKILIVGAGGIGSNTCYNIAKTLPVEITIVDFDIVQAHNVGSQFFRKSDIGYQKVQSLSAFLRSFNDAKINPVAEKYQNRYLPIMITGLDNMATRKQCFKEWCKHDDRELFIDGRMKANLYEVYVVTKGREQQYQNTLFDDKEVEEGPCTFRQTAYVGMLIGARITHCLVNYLMNKYDDAIYPLPFKIQEVTEPFLINIE